MPFCDRIVSAICSKKGEGKGEIAYHHLQIGEKFLNIVHVDRILWRRDCGWDASKDSLDRGRVWGRRRDGTGGGRETFLALRMRGGRTSSGSERLLALSTLANRRRRGTGRGGTSCESERLLSLRTLANRK